MPPPGRLALRIAESKPHLAALKELIESIAKDATPSSRLGKARSHALAQWEHLVVFAAHGRIELDNDSMERHMKAVATGRKNWLFAGNEQGGRRAAVMYTLIEICRTAGVDPFAYLTELLTRLPAATECRQAPSMTPDATGRPAGSPTRSSRGGHPCGYTVARWTPRLPPIVPAAQRSPRSCCSASRSRRAARSSAPRLGSRAVTRGPRGSVRS
jgi:hypothetical protein